MVWRPGPELGGWLRAEREGREEEADRRFARVFAESVPRLSPSAGFADAVLQSWRAAAWSRRLVPDPEPVWRRRLALSVLLVVGTMIAAGLPALVLDFGLQAASFQRLQNVLATAASALSVCRETAAVLLAVARAMAVAAASGPATIILTVNLALAFMAWCGLSRLLVNGEEE